jgi:hypothetical protein
LAEYTGGQRTSTGKRPAGKIALVISGAAVIAVVSASLIPGCGAKPPASPQSGPGDARSAAGGHIVQLAATGQRAATLAVVTGTATLTVTAAAIPGSLMRVTTPGNAGIRPQLVSSMSRVQLSLLATGQRGPSAVSIELSTAVTWQLKFTGGTSQTVLNLSSGQVASIDFTAGSNLIQMTLPRPAGTATITLAGGANQVNLVMPPGVAAQLRLDAGASTATLAGRTHVGPGRGTVLSSPGWAQAASRYYVDAPAGINDISVAG